MDYRGIGVGEQHTVASTPGGVTLNIFKWLYYDPIWPFLFAVLLLALFPVLKIIPSSIGAGWMMVGMVLNVGYWSRAIGRFKEGCANPGIIISLSPLLIAVYTDMSKGDGDYPAVKIMKTRMPRVGKAPFQVGMRVPTVALYSAGMLFSGMMKPHWIDFYPVPVACGSWSDREVERVKQAIPKEEWEMLETWVKEHPQTAQPGLYFFAAPQAANAGE